MHTQKKLFRSLDGHSADGATCVRLSSSGGRYLATVHHDGREVASISEGSAAAALVSLGRVLGALLLTSTTNELALAIARDLHTFGVDA